MKKLALAAPAVVATLVLAVTSAAVPSSAGGPHVRVYLTRGEQLGAVSRPGGTLEQALRALLAGPTAAERAQGFRTQVPAGTVLHGVDLRGGVATVDVSRGFGSGGTASVTARLAQLTFTATGFPAVTGVRVALDGELADTLGGVPVDEPLTRARFAAPEYVPPMRAPPPPGPPSAAVRAVQARLAALGYLRPGGVDGLYGDETRQAILAFQGWSGLPRTGAVSAPLRRRLAAAARPVPRTRDRHIEVWQRRQVALLVDGRRVVRAVHVSTGKPSTPTPVGTFRVYRKELHSWSVPFATWLPYASYFSGGVAFHEYPEVPAYPASHGCVRVPASEAPTLYRFARLGTRVAVDAAAQS